VSRPGRFEAGGSPLVEGFQRDALRRRRVHSARVRRRRLLVADLGIGTALGLLALVLAPGLAIAALAALFVLAGCGVAAARQRHSQRRLRVRYPRRARRRASQPKKSSAVL
jgi:hypothetical protein